MASTEPVPPVPLTSKERLKSSPQGLGAAGRSRTPELNVHLIESALVSRAPKSGPTLVSNIVHLTSAFRRI